MIRLLLLALLALSLCACDKQKGKTARELNPNFDKEFPVAESVDPVDLGVDLYPGSVTPKGLPPVMRASMDGTQFGQPGIQVATIECWRETGDLPKKVGDFYQSALKDSNVTAVDSGVTVDGLNSVGEKVRIIASRKSGAKVTAITIVVIRKVRS